MTRLHRNLTLSAALATALTGSIFGAASTTVAAEAPSVETIFENCVKAVGGQKAIDNVKTLHINTTMSMMGMQFDVDQAWSREGGRLMKVNMMGQEMITGSDGTTAWMKSQMGYMLAPPDEAADLESFSGIFMFMLDPKTFAKKSVGDLTVVGEEEFEGKKCHKLKFNKKDKGDGHVYFEADTGLPVGYEELGEGAEDDRNVMVMGDWKEVEGVKFFHLMTMKSVPGPNSGNPPMEGEMKVTKIEVNTLPADHFALPEQVKELVKNQPKEGEPAEEIKLEQLTPEAQAEATKMLEGIKGQPGTNIIKQIVSQMEMGISSGQLPPDQTTKFKYIVQELKKELATRGG